MKGTRAVVGVVSTIASLVWVGVHIYRDLALNPGKPCDMAENLAECRSDDEIMLCDRGTYATFQCDGPKGCYADGKDVVCDQSGNKVGTRCRAYADDGEAMPITCAPDLKTMLVCAAGRIVREPCRGPEHCQPDGDNVSCDQSVGEAGDVCAEKSGACAQDGSTLLSCADGELVFGRKCRGPKGCRVNEEHVLCDTTLGEVGDRCHDGGTCSTDKRAVLKCKNGKLEVFHQCRGPVDCGLFNDSFDCDPGVGRVGDPCEQNVAACSEDAMSQLNCSQGRFKKTADCPTGCEVSNDLVTCR